MCPRDSLINLFDNYPARAMGYEDHLSAVTVLPVRCKQVIHIIQELPAPTEDVELSRDKHPVGCARAKPPREYPGVATQVWKQVSGPKGRQVTGLISILVARPSVKRRLRTTRWALPRRCDAAITAGPATLGPARPLGRDNILGRPPSAVRKVNRARSERRPEYA